MKFADHAKDRSADGIIYDDAICIVYSAVLSTAASHMILLKFVLFSKRSNG